MAFILIAGFIATLLVSACAGIAGLLGASSHAIAVGVEIVLGLMAAGGTIFDIVAARHEPFGLVMTAVMGAILVFIVGTGPIGLPFS
jgi:riboflavin synthase